MPYTKISIPKLSTKYEADIQVPLAKQNSSVDDLASVALKQTPSKTEALEEKIIPVSISPLSSGYSLLDNLAQKQRQQLDKQRQQSWLEQQRQHLNQQGQVELSPEIQIANHQNQRLINQFNQSSLARRLQPDGARAQKIDYTNRLAEIDEEALQPEDSVVETDDDYDTTIDVDHKSEYQEDSVPLKPVASYIPDANIVDISNIKSFMAKKTSQEEVIKETEKISYKRNIARLMEDNKYGESISLILQTMGKVVGIQELIGGPDDVELLTSRQEKVVGSATAIQFMEKSMDSHRDITRQALSENKNTTEDTDTFSIMATIGIPAGPVTVTAGGGYTERNGKINGKAAGTGIVRCIVNRLGQELDTKAKPEDILEEHVLYTLLTVKSLDDFRDFINKYGIGFITGVMTGGSIDITGVSDGTTSGYTKGRDFSIIGGLSVGPSFNVTTTIGKDIRETSEKTKTYFQAKARGGLSLISSYAKSYDELLMNWKATIDAQPVVLSVKITTYLELLNNLKLNKTGIYLPGANLELSSQEIDIQRHRFAGFFFETDYAKPDINVRVNQQIKLCYMMPANQTFSYRWISKNFGRLPSCGPQLLEAQINLADSKLILVSLDYFNQIRAKRRYVGTSIKLLLEIAKHIKEAADYTKEIIHDSRGIYAIIGELAGELYPLNIASLMNIKIPGTIEKDESSNQALLSMIDISRLEMGHIWWQFSDALQKSASPKLCHGMHYHISPEGLGNRYLGQTRYKIDYTTQTSYNLLCLSTLPHSFQLLNAKKNDIYNVEENFRTVNMWFIGFVSQPNRNTTNKNLVFISMAGNKKCSIYYDTKITLQIKNYQVFLQQLNNLKYEKSTAAEAISLHIGRIHLKDEYDRSQVMDMRVEINNI